MNKKRKIYSYSDRSPAKVNIGLRVLSRRRDGFHNIETIFYPVKLTDNITVNIESLNDSFSHDIISVKTDPELGIGNGKNICYRAVTLFVEKFKVSGHHRFNIRIKKRIPTGAGLGGGSSNAASVLKILSKHFGFNERKQMGLLKKVAAELGSDVPFFLQGKPAYAEGKGEKLTLLPDFKIKSMILVVNPGIHISTPTAYRDLNVKIPRAKKLNRIKKYSNGNEKLMINDFERTVFKKHPKIEKIKYDLLKSGAVFALMSGSGSSVYGVFNDSRKLATAKLHFKKQGYRVFSA